MHGNGRMHLILSLETVATRWPGRRRGRCRPWTKQIYHHTDLKHKTYAAVLKNFYAIKDVVFVDCHAL